MPNSQNTLIRFSTMIVSLVLAVDQADAATYTLDVGGSDYPIETRSIAYSEDNVLEDFLAELKVTPWWGSQATAEDFSLALNTEGVHFAFGFNAILEGFIDAAVVTGSEQTLTSIIPASWQNRTYALAVATPAPVPLPAAGLGLLTALSSLVVARRARRS